MKQLQDLDWVKLAVSKDETRMNLTDIYRDKNSYVGTDGHRLHISNGLPDAEPHYLGDGEFPAYKKVMKLGKPKHAFFLPPVTVAELLTITGAIKKLHNAMQAPRKKDKLSQKYFTEFSICKNSPFRIITSSTYANSEAPFTCDFQLSVNPGMDFEDVPTFALNASYLADALRGFPQGARLEYFGQYKAITLTDSAEHRKALIMPLRLP